MYVRVFTRTSPTTIRDVVTYHDLKSVSINLETDITLATIPACEFTVEIFTTDNIDVGRWIGLYGEPKNESDDQYNIRYLYAEYRIVNTEYTDSADGNNAICKVFAQSDVGLMDRWVMKASFVRNVSLRQCLYRLTNADFIKYGTAEKINITYYSVPGSVLDTPITGYMPEQTARERLQQLCLACGLGVKQWKTAGISLFKGADTHAIIPYEDVFWMPKENDLDEPSAVYVDTFDGWTFTEIDPESITEGEVVSFKTSDGNDVWGIKYPHSLEIVNSDNPYGCPISIDNITIVSPDNELDIENDLSLRYFNGKEWTFDVVNNHQYFPGMSVTFVSDVNPESTNCPFSSGIIKSCDFTFGVQNRARLTVVGDNILDIGGHIYVHYVHTYEDAEGNEHILSLGRNNYYSPPGTSITIKHPPIYVDVVGETRIFQPTVEQSTITVGEGPEAIGGDSELTIEYELEVS